MFKKTSTVADEIERGQQVRKKQKRLNREDNLRRESQVLLITEGQFHIVLQNTLTTTKTESC